MKRKNRKRQGNKEQGGNKKDIIVERKERKGEI